MFSRPASPSLPLQFNPEFPPQQLKDDGEILKKQRSESRTICDIIIVFCAINTELITCFWRALLQPREDRCVALAGAKQ
jgi:hypothetical protein